MEYVTPKLHYLVVLNGVELKNERLFNEFSAVIGHIFEEKSNSKKMLFKVFFFICNSTIEDVMTIE